MFEAGFEIAHRFVLTRRLGGGEHAPVWQALDRRSGTTVVLKLQRGREAGLEAEFAALRDLEHPGVLRGREFLRDGDASCLVMDQAVGDLARLRGRAWREWLPPVRQVAQALAYLHERGLVHGDVKAANVLINEAGAARLADFGNLKAIGAARDPAEPISHYSVSEQQRSAQPAHPGDDVYGYGALLAELLSGRPPGYGSESTAADARASLVPVQAAPARLVELAERCLRTAPSERPTMREVDLELAAVTQASPTTTATTPVLTPPQSAAEALRANWQRASAGVGSDAVQARRQGFRAGLVVTALVALGLVALALFIVPAIHTSPPAAVAPRPVPGPAAPAAAESPPPTPQDLEALAQQKSVADELRAGVNTRLTALLTADSASWAAAQTRAAQEKLAAADALMQKREYPAAQAQLRELGRELGPIEAQRGPALQAALQRGQAALDSGQSAAAAAAFAEVLRIGPNNAAAVRGARRAASLDAENAQLARAHELERQGQTAAAAAAYRQALAIDADSPEAQRGAGRTGGALRDDQFGQAMARAYAAINSGHETEARAALEDAKRLKPQDPEIARAVAQIGAQDAAAALAAALAQARAAEAAERWQDAVTQYQRALALDATLVDARRALGIAQQRAQLNLELEELIAHPDRAYSDAVYAAAQSTLQRARAVTSPGPVLSRQVERVTELLGQAATPVNVTLRSDNMTTVTVYRVGELGNFTERALQLKPGRYVVVGTRAGYRDVRRELNVAPGQAATALVIQCVEPI